MWLGTRHKPYSPDVKSPIQIAPIFYVGLQNLGTKRFVQSTGCFLLVSESWFLCCVRQITDYEILLTYLLTDKEQKLLWLAFFASFATKVPMIPVHIWLPEAHVEAPTAGSVIHA